MYPLSFRKHVLRIREEESLTFDETARRFGIGRATLNRWVRRIECKQRKKRPGKICDDALRRDVQIYPDAYQSERAIRFGVSAAAIHYALKRIGVTYKKNNFAIHRQTKIYDVAFERKLSVIKI